MCIRDRPVAVGHPQQQAQPDRILARTQIALRPDGRGKPLRVAADLIRRQAVSGVAAHHDRRPSQGLGASVIQHQFRRCRDCLLYTSGLIAAYELVIEGSDRFATKYLVNDACVLAGNKPYIGASIRSFAGMLAVYAAPGGPCYRCLFPEMPDPATVPSCAQAGVLGTVPGLFGVLQAHEALKLILGIGEPLVGALLTVDLLTMRLQKLRLPRDPHCVVCGDTPSIVTLAETDWACAAQAASAADAAAARCV